MRLLLPLATASVLSASGCTAYLKAQSRTKSARAEGGDIALGGVAQLIVGGLVTVGSYYLYQHAETNEMPTRDGLTASHGGVAGVLVGSALVLGGLADGTIALYQAMSGDHLIASPPEPMGGQKPLSAQGLNAFVFTPLTP